MLTQLKELFPSYQSLNPSDVIDEQTDYVFKYGDETIVIPKADINDRETKLLNLLNQIHHQEIVKSSQSSWYRYLVLDEPVVIKLDHPVFFVHFKIEDHEDFSLVDWTTVFQEAIPDIIDVFQVEGNQYVAVLKLIDGAELVPQINHLNAIIQTLDIDFSTSTRGFVGQLTRSIDKLRLNYLFERRLFEMDLSPSFTHQNISSLSHLMIEWMGQMMKASIETLDVLRQALRKKEYYDLVKTLFITGGNVTQASELLYIHRNTLVYRVNKFKSQTGFDLQNMHDLMIAMSLI